MTKKDNPLFIESKNHIHNTNNISKDDLLSLFKKTIKEDAKNIFEEHKSELITSIHSAADDFIEEELSNIFNYNHYPEINDVFRNFSEKKDFSDFVQGSVRSHFLKELKKRTSFDLNVKQPLIHDISIKDSQID